jgi:serine/threonine-protein kinase
VVDGRADLFAFGVMLFEMLAGVRPYVAKNQVAILGQMLSQPVPTFSQRAPGVMVPPTVESFVHRLLAREVDERCQSAAEAYVCIEGLLGSVPQSDGRLFTLAGGSPTAVMGPSSYRDSVANMPSSLLSRASAPSLADSLHELSRPSLVRSSSAALVPDTLPAPTPPAPKATTVELLVTRLQKAADYLDTRKRELPPPFLEVVRGVPGRILLGALAFGVLGIVTAVVAVIVMLSRGDAQEQPAGFVPTTPSNTPSGETRTEPAKSPLEARIARAETEGLPAVEALARELPAEGSVLVALARARAKAGKFEEAVTAVSDALAIDPKLNESPRIAGVLFRCAQAPAASSATFRLLEGPMGTRGADIIYDLANTRGVRPAVKTTAEKLLRTKDFLSTASPALEIAVALRRAESCTEYAKLLQPAKNVGDARSLEFLRPLTSKTGCGTAKKSDCYECLRKNDALAQAIATIEKRSATQKPRSE